MKLLSRRGIIAATIAATTVATTALIAPAGVAEQTPAPEESVTILAQDADAAANNDEPTAQPKAIGGVFGIISTVISILTAIFQLVQKFLPKN